MILQDLKLFSQLFMINIRNMRTIILFLIFGFVCSNIYSQQIMGDSLKMESISHLKMNKPLIMQMKSIKAENSYKTKSQRNSLIVIEITREKQSAPNNYLMTKAKLSNKKTYKSQEKDNKLQVVETNLKKQSEPIEIKSSAVRTEGIKDFNSNSKN